MNRRKLLPALLALPLAISAKVKAAEAPKVKKSWFVQCWTQALNDPPIVEDHRNPGRIEVSLDGKFVACNQGFAIKNWDYYELAPISMGFIVEAYNLDELKFETFDELKRLTKLNVKITENTDKPSL